MNESPKPTLIIKLGEELEWNFFVRKDKLVKALKMPEDFLLETSLGFLPGKRGDYVVEVGPKIRFPCHAEDFLNAYYPVEKLEADRRSGTDRRSNERTEPA